jgi:hypothetical protein
MAHLCCDIVECALWRTWEIIEPNLEKSAYPLGMEQELRIGFEAFSKIFVTVTFKVEESSLTILDFHVDHDNGGSPTNPGGSTRGKKAKGIMIEMLGLQGLPAIRLKSNRDAKAEFQDKVIRPSSLICGVFIGRPWRGLHLPPPTKIREQVHAGPSGICYKSAFYFLNQSIR